MADIFQFECRSCSVAPELASPAPANDAAAQGWLSGTAKCLDCGTEWAAVAEVGTVSLECPQCKTSRGVMAGPVAARATEQYWICACDCSLFRIVADERGKFKELLCIKCGLPQEF